jgi:hypothetical protein
MKSLAIFVLGVVLGAALMFGAHRLHLGRLLVSNQARMQAAVAGNWQGTVNIEGHEIDFALAVKNDGHALSGIISSSRVGDFPCDQVQVDPAGDVAFSAHVADKSAKFTGKLAPGHHAMSGDMKGTAMDGTWSLAKQS